MSLGLKDLKKKSSKKSSPKKTLHVEASAFSGAETSETLSMKRERFPAGAWAKSFTARPWSSGALNKGTRPRRSSVPTDAVMNEEWLNLYAEPVLGLGDNEDQSTFAVVKTVLETLESKLERALSGPLHIIQTVSQSITQK